MYRVDGDGTWQNTKIWKDGVLIDWEYCEILVDINDCVIRVDGEEGVVSRVLLLGIYQLVGEGLFSNTRLIINDDVVRGVSSVRVIISKGKPTKMEIDAIFLPNIVETKESNGIQ